MLSCDEFCKVYWRHFISLEKEFVSTLTYVSLDTDNFSTYSEAYAKLILEIGSEVDVVLKVYCKQLKSNFKKDKIDDYSYLIKNKNPEFCNQIVSVQNTNITLPPWENWNIEYETISKGKRKIHNTSPFWWVAYNKIKHERTDLVKIESVKKESYKFANLKYTLSALAGLYQTLIYIYYDLAHAENKRIFTPLPGSRILQMVGSTWDSVEFYYDYALYIDYNDGFAKQEFSTIRY
jgi:hypothetical protein